MSVLTDIAEARAFHVAIVSHGERADHVFGQDWCKQFFTEAGEYVRIDLNMPASLQSRRPIEHWAIDPPLTELGKWQARQVGEALAASYKFGAIACSPAHWCHQTAVEIRHSLPNLPGVVIEPGLLEMGSWCSDKIQDAFKARAKDPCTITEAPPPDEGVDEWFERSDKVFRAILHRHAHCGKGDLLIVAHGLSHEALTYGMLRQDQQEGAVPPEIKHAQGYKAKVAALSELCRKGRGNKPPRDSYCGTAVVRYNVNGDLEDADLTVPLKLSHRSSSAPQPEGSSPAASRGDLDFVLKHPALEAPPRALPPSPTRSVSDATRPRSVPLATTPVQAARDLLASGDLKQPPALGPPRSSPPGASDPSGRRTTLTPVIGQRELLQQGDALKGTPLRRTISMGTKQQVAQSHVQTPQWIVDIAQQQRAPISPQVGNREAVPQAAEVEVLQSTPIQQQGRTPQVGVRSSPSAGNRKTLPASAQRSAVPSALRVQSTDRYAPAPPPGDVTANSLLLASPRLSLGGNPAASPPAMKRQSVVQNARNTIPVGHQIVLPGQRKSAATRKPSPQGASRLMNAWVEDAYVAF